MLKKQIMLKFSELKLLYPKNIERIYQNPEQISSLVI
jgi:hypothetical protein